MSPIQTVLDIAERGGELLAASSLILFVVAWLYMIGYLVVDIARWIIG